MKKIFYYQHKINDILALAIVFSLSLMFYFMSKIFLLMFLALYILLILRFNRNRRSRGRSRVADFLEDTVIVQDARGQIYIVCLDYSLPTICVIAISAIYLFLTLFFQQVHEYFPLSLLIVLLICFLYLRCYFKNTSILKYLENDYDGLELSSDISDVLKVIKVISYDHYTYIISYKDKEGKVLSSSTSALHFFFNYEELIEILNNFQSHEDVNVDEDRHIDIEADITHPEENKVSEIEKVYYCNYVDSLRSHLYILLGNIVLLVISFFFELNFLMFVIITVYCAITMILFYIKIFLKRKERKGNRAYSVMDDIIVKDDKGFLYVVTNRAPWLIVMNVFITMVVVVLFLANLNFIYFVFCLCFPFVFIYIQNMYYVYLRNYFTYLHKKIFLTDLSYVKDSHRVLVEDAYYAYKIENVNYYEDGVFSMKLTSVDKMTKSKKNKYYIISDDYEEYDYLIRDLKMLSQSMNR